MICFAALGVVLLCSCVHNDTQSKEAAPTTADLIAKAAADRTPPKPMQLPVRYQNPAFVTVDDNRMGDEITADQEYAIKVGANIRSTRGPQKLWDIMRRLASLKGMSVSWASDVDQHVMVNVDINANDDYFKAIDNLLRQVDYFHEVKDSTIIVKYKETKTYHVAMPFTTQLYETATGGDVLGSNDAAGNLRGTINLESSNNEFDIWKNIQENLDTIIATWSTIEATPEPQPVADEGSTDAEQAATPSRTRQVSSSGNTYTIDKPVGLITVNAPRPLQKTIENYLNNIKKELYKQVTIEAKIIEVQLSDDSTLGIDWHLLLNSLSFGGGSLSFNQNYSKTIGPDGTSTTRTDSSDYNRTKVNSQENNSSQNNSLTEAPTSTSTSGSTTSGTTGVVTNDNTVLSNTTSDTTSNVGTSLSESKSKDTITDTLGAVTSAVTTAATIVTGGMANAASGSVALASFNFADFLHALSNQGTTSILANPKLSVMNGQPALITVGKNVTYISEVTANVEGQSGVTTYTPTTASILSGVGLAITPVIKNDNEIIMTIVPVTSVLKEPIEYRIISGGQVGLPIVSIREMSSMVQIKDGEMLVIGGLITSVESTSGENLFPGLADVPILKYLTGYETKVMQKRELIILLRPHILQ